LKENFGFEQILNLKKVHDGFTSGHSFDSEQGKKFVKLYPARIQESSLNREFYHNLFSIKESFYENSVPIYMPIRNIHGKIFFVADEKFAELYDFIDYKTPEVNEDNAAQIAEILSKIHNSKTNFKSSYNFSVILQEISIFLGRLKNLESQGILFSGLSPFLGIIDKSIEKIKII